MTVSTRITPATAVAASLCWLARFRHGDVGQTSDAAGHKPGCRFCLIPLDRLLTDYGTGNVEPGTYKPFMALGRLDREALIREAQEVQWFERLDDA